MNLADALPRLSLFLAREIGVPGVEITHCTKMAGGASRAIWSLDLAYDREGTRRSLPLVLRCDPPGAAIETRRRDEHALLRAAAAAGVPVPGVHWLSEDASILGGAFFLMDRIDGETLPRRLLRDAEYAPARAVMTEQLGAILAGVHRIDPDGLPFLARPEPGQSGGECELDRYQRLYEIITPDPHPAFELAFRWLRQHVPPSPRLGVVHGDFRIGNVIFGPEGVRSILDWELAHVGDPMEDLGWLCVRSWRFGNDHLPVGGIGTRAALFAAYERAGGEPVDPEHVRFWEILGNLKWGVITILQAKTYLDGSSRSVELASLGRRTAEIEIELLELIDAPSPMAREACT